MALLVLFAFVAGAGTAVSPCVLPVLPALLSAGATGGRRRPLGIVLGLTVTFTVTIVGLASVVDGVGFGDGARWLAIVFLLGFGVAVAVPAVGARLEAPLSRLARFGPGRTGDGFVSGLAVGGALGFVYAPCAGPILAAVIAVSAASGETVAVGLAYALGSAVVLLALTLGGRRLIERLRRGSRGPVLHQALGAVMVLTALAMVADLDLRFQTAIADDLPDVVVNPTRPLEESAAVKGRLDDLAGASKFDSARAPMPAAPRSDLPRLGRAPDFANTQRWFNTPGGAPQSIAALNRAGRVVLLDFWTYTCINCIRTFPELRALHERYAKAGLTVVGVHTPEFAFERDAGNVEEAIGANRLRYPVVQDNEYGTWNAYGNRFWPAQYLVGADGQVRYTHFGEGGARETEAAVRSLLAEAGRARQLGARAKIGATVQPTAQATPETYLGARRAERFLPEAPARGTRTFRRFGGELPLSSFTLDGTWRVGEESSTAVRRAGLRARFQARDVYLVLSKRGRRYAGVDVHLDGRRIRSADAGPDVRRGRVAVRGQRLYHLVALRGSQRHVLELRFAPGVSGYAFTFG